MSILLQQNDRPNSGRPLPLPKVAASEGLPLPVPKAAVSQGLPQKREPLVQQEKEPQGGKATTDSASSKSSSMSDGIADDTPRVSVLRRTGSCH